MRVVPVLLVVGTILLASFAITDVTSYTESTIMPDVVRVDAESQETFVDSIVPHVDTPDSVRAIYMSSWIAGTPSLRKKLVQFVEDSRINSVIIDVKDSTGVISFKMENELVRKYNTDTNRVPDMDEFIADLHDKGIYVIGRISVFQDPKLAKAAPELAFKRKDNGNVWADRKGLAFMNPKNEEVWDYNAAVAKEAYDRGFDEINLDYIRYPSDGNMSNLDYDFDEGEIRTDVMRRFYVSINETLHEHGIVTSGDFFGFTTSNKDDLSIGQVWEDFIGPFDYVGPMVYPSHYPKSYLGYTNSAAHPYAVIKHVMQDAVDRTKAAGESTEKIRTWIQDFDLGANYGKKEIQDQIKATYEVGLDSYMVWDAKNVYTKEAYYDNLLEVYENENEQNN